MSVRTTSKISARWLQAFKLEVTFSHKPQSIFPHQVCVISVCSCVCTCECVCVLSISAPPPPRQLGVCTPPTVLVPTSEPPGTTTKALSPPSGMYPLHQHHHDHCPTSLQHPPTAPHQHSPRKLIRFFFFPPHFSSLTSYPTYMILPHPFFAPFIVRFIITLFILLTLHIVCLA